MRTLCSLLAAGIGGIATAGVAESLAVAALLGGAGLALLLAALAADRAGANRLLPGRAANPAFPLGAAWPTYFATTAAGVALSLYGPAMLQFSFGQRQVQLTGQHADSVLPVPGAPTSSKEFNGSKPCSRSRSACRCSVRTRSRASRTPGSTTRSLIRRSG